MRRFVWKRLSGVVAVAVAVPVLSAAAIAPPAAGRPAVPQPDPAVPAVAAADRHVAGRSGSLRGGPDETFVRRSVTAGTRGLHYVAYERVYRGLPVIGGDVVVVTDRSGAVSSTSAAPIVPLSVGTTPKVTAAAAMAIARQQVDTVGTATDPRLVVHALGTPRLAWEVFVEGSSRGMPTRLHVHVDAVSGTVVATWDEVRDGTANGYYNGRVTIGTSMSGGSYVLRDPTRANMAAGNYNTRQIYTDADDVWGNGTGTDLVTAAADAQYAGNQLWDYLKNRLGRNGIDGNGRAFPMYVGLNQANAFWNGTFATFGRSSDGQRQATPIDVVAHELGHGIFQYTPGGSGGGRETGGLNEGTGDIFGALTEFAANNPNDSPDYLVGEEVNLVGGGPIRNMYNPGLKGHPNCWSTSIPNTEVHAAAGPLNHWFYLTAEGSSPGGGKPNSPTCNGSSVTGISVWKAGEIYYNGLLRKTSSWTYALARKATLEAAQQLYPGSCVEFDTVKMAWDAVSVRPASGEPTSCTPTGPAPPSNLTATVSGSSVDLRWNSSPSTGISHYTIYRNGTEVTTTPSNSHPVTGVPDGQHTFTVTATTTSGQESGPSNAVTVTVGGGGGVVFSDDFETAQGWTVDPNGTDTATGGRWERANPETTTYNGITVQNGVTPGSGYHDLVTGALAGSDVGTHDVDGGLTSIQSPPITLAGGTFYTLSFAYYLAHLSNATSADYLRIRVIGSSGAATTVFAKAGTATDVPGAFQTTSADLTGYAGQTIRLLVEAADNDAGSLVETAVDDVKVTSGGGGGSPVVTNPGDQTAVAGNPVTLQIRATDPGGLPLRYSAAGLPAGLSTNTGTGLMSGTPTAAGTSTVTVTATNTSGTAGSASFAWTIRPGGTPDIDPAAVRGHLSALQTIATNNGGNRYTGRPGYGASVTYVRDMLSAAGYTVTVQTFSTTAGPSYNVLAETPGGDHDNVIMVGSHLDSVSSGPGINDNGSGSAGVLEVALALARSGRTPAKAVRFGFWGAEELGLVGSRYYTSSLGTTGRAKIDSYVNFDMIGSPNYGYFVYNDDSRGGSIRDMLVRYLQSRGLQTELISDIGGRSDHGSFTPYRIPTGGAFTGAEKTKTSTQVQKWGGTAGVAFDRCYNSSCDTISNVNMTALDYNSDAIAHTIWTLAGIALVPWDSRCWRERLRDRQM